MKLLVSFILLLFLSSCMKLDQNLFNEDNEITAYLLDDYQGEQDFRLDQSFDIPPSLIHLLTLDSQLPDETAPVQIRAVYIGDQNKISSDTVILYCHGNKWHMDFYWQRAKLLAHVNEKNRYGVLMMDYRGYGLSEGTPSEEGMYADVESCLKWLKENGLTDERLIMYGFSLGSAPTCELSSRPRHLWPAKIVLEAPFASAEVMVQDASRLNMPASYFTDLKIDNAEEIKKVSAPLLWIHGDEDNFLNYKTHGMVVFKNHPGSHNQKFLVSGADHGEVPEKMGFQNYLNLLKLFITK